MEITSGITKIGATVFGWNSIWIPMDIVRLCNLYDLLVLEIDFLAFDELLDSIFNSKVQTIWKMITNSGI